MTKYQTNGLRFKGRVNNFYSDYFTGKSVLVTGAGGSIGSELCKQVAQSGASQVIMLDSSEYNLYALDQKMGAAAYCKCLPLIGDVRDIHVMQSVFHGFRPEVVIHAAALKHVPMLETEHNMIEGVLTNVKGTKVVAECVAECDWVKSFTLISTDKAVNPTSFMGMTKRCAEKVMHMFNDKKFSIVRFGNVFGSSGSVVPLFKKQILAGGPVTVTHPDMTRYIMGVSEAVSLVLAAAALSADYEKMGTYVLDMGEAIRINDLACTLIRMYGMEPGEEIAVDYIGMRPGEKLEEELFYPYEHWENTKVNGVRRVRAEPLSQRDKEAVLQLTEYAEIRDGAGVKASLMKIVPEYRTDLSAQAPKKFEDVSGTAGEFVSAQEGNRNGHQASQSIQRLIELERNFSVGDWFESLAVPIADNQPEFPIEKHFNQMNPNGAGTDRRIPDPEARFRANGKQIENEADHADLEVESAIAR